MFIQTEATPNPATLKFLPGRTVLATGTLEMRDKAEAAQSPLAERLFDINGVGGVFFGSDFITVTKSDGEWPQLKPAILGAIMEHFMSGAPVVAEGAGGETSEAGEFFEANDAETVATIKELIETRVRPAVANDGGDITFRGFKDGIVYLAHEGLLLGLPVVHRDAQARHPEPAASFRARRDRGPADLDSASAADRATGSVARRSSSCAFLPSTPRSGPARPPCSIRKPAPSWRANRSRMVRGHAEALMPLIARVMDAARCEFTELDRIAVTVGPGSFTGLRVGISAARGIALAAGKPAIGLIDLAALAAPACRGATPIRPMHRGDRCAQRAGLFAGVRAERRPTSCRRGSTACATAVRAVPRRAGHASSARARRWSRRTGRRGAPPPQVDDARARPTSAGSRGSAPPRRTSGAAPKPLYLRAPDAQPQDAAPAAAPMIGLLTGLFGRAEPVLSDADAARCRGARGAARRLVPPRLERARVRAAADRSQRDRPTARCAGARSSASSCRGCAADEAEILSVAVARARARARACAPRCSICICAGLPGSALRAVFLEVDEDNAPARRLYARAGFREVGRRPGYYRRAGKRRAGAAPRPCVRPCRRMIDGSDRDRRQAELIEAQCVAKGMRMTEQRRVIARVLADSADHPDVEELYRRCAEIDEHISISTVYRTVKLFEDAGIIDAPRFPRGPRPLRADPGIAPRPPDQPAHRPGDRVPVRGDRAAAGARSRASSATGWSITGSSFMPCRSTMRNPNADAAGDRRSFGVCAGHARADAGAMACGRRSSVRCGGAFRCSITASSAACSACACA